MSKEDSPPEPPEFEWEFIVPDIDFEKHMTKYWWRFVPDAERFTESKLIKKIPKPTHTRCVPDFTGLKFKLGEDKHTH